MNIFWFRRDLRLFDNHGLYQALKAGKPVLPIFIFDTEILDDLDDPRDRRVSYIYDELDQIHEYLVEQGSGLRIFHGSPLDIYRQLVQEFDIDTVYCNRDYEPYAQQRDLAIYQWLNSKGIDFKGYKDQVIFEKAEVVKGDGKPYTVFTPFSRKWRARLEEQPITTYPSEKLVDNFYRHDAQPFPSISLLGFELNLSDIPDKQVEDNLLKHYKEKRDFPAKPGTSRQGVHLRFGTISIRRLVLQAMKSNQTFLNELIWREFYMMILYHFPQVVNQSFKPKYDNIPWRNNSEEFLAWCEGRTGYPIVDAGMRELVTTGYMHNRVRMIVASFLTKHLLIDWRWGEAFFAKHLLDYELASNNGGWQWAAGTGCDAAPYFRVFYPYLQTDKFDPKKEYIRKWVPEFESDEYPEPIVVHKEARVRAIETYKTALG